MLVVEEGICVVFCFFFGEDGDMMDVFNNFKYDMNVRLVFILVNSIDLWSFLIIVKISSGGGMFYFFLYLIEN